MSIKFLALYIDSLSSIPILTGTFKLNKLIKALCMVYMNTIISTPSASWMNKNTKVKLIVSVPETKPIKNKTAATTGTVMIDDAAKTRRRCR
jgi:hypothetical protein